MPKINDFLALREKAVAADVDMVAMVFDGFGNAADIFARFIDDGMDVSFRMFQ
jgi:hypothetical protein